MITIPVEYIGMVNALLLVLFMLVLYQGYKKGFILQLLGLVSTGVALFIAWLFAPVFIRIFSGFVSVSPTTLNAIDVSVNKLVNQLIWFVVLFIAVRIILMVVTPIATLISKMPLVKQVNSVFGGVFSIVVYFVYVLLLIFFLTLPVVKNGSQVINDSILSPIHSVSKPVFGYVNNEINRNTALQSILMHQKLTQEQEDEIVSWLQQQGFTQNAIKEFLARYER